MKHKEVLKVIDEFLFEGKEISKEVRDHIMSCNRCRKYFENSERFSRGLSQLKSISIELSNRIRLDTFNKTRLGWISIEIKKSMVRKIVLSLVGIVIVLLGVIVLFYHFYPPLPFYEDLAKEWGLMEEHVSYIFSFDEIYFDY